MSELLQSPRLQIRRLGMTDLGEIMQVYRDCKEFFLTLVGLTKVSEEYVRDELNGVPPNFDSANKYFMGIFLNKTGQMIGVVDFLINYPEPGKGCLGLLLIRESVQSQGIGREALGIVEKWAHNQGIHEVTLGVELVNKKAYRFWMKNAYLSTGEFFDNSTEGRVNRAEGFRKILKYE